MVSTNVNDASERRTTINLQRLWKTIERSSQIGIGRPGGLRRLTLTDDDRTMRDLFVSWCTDAGCRVTIDRVGNIFARRPGRDDSLPPVVIGSHLDTQVNGGRFDGILGVLAGLEIVRTLNDASIQTHRPIEIVSWTNEEGARFAPPMLGAGAFARLYDLDWVLSRTDDDGKRLGDELTRIGYAGEAPVGGRTLDSYFELHIEQGPILDAEGFDVGIVTHGYIVHGGIVEVRGETAHTGPCPMDRRKNALVGGAMLAVAVNDIGCRYHLGGGKATASRLVAWPNRPGILSDWAQLTCDVRHEDRAIADRMWADVLEAMAECSRRAQVEMSVIDRWAFGQERFDPELVDLLRRSASRLGIPARELPSQAGHDAYHIGTIAPMVMVFTPCKDGITHNNREDVAAEHAAPAVNVLLNAVVTRANR